ncbi:MAG: DLW-39 family protein [Nakamurella sp.]
MVDRGLYWMVRMKKILLLVGIGAAAAVLIQRRRQAAAAEAALWDEATGKSPTAGVYPGPATT